MAIAGFVERLAGRDAWGALGREVARWRRAGHAPCLWWRDDDARRPCAALERLCALSATHGAPVALAVIPDVDLTELAAAIAPWPLVRAIQHGCDHVDRNQGGGFSAEFSPASPPEEIAAVIEAAWARLKSATNAAPIYAPPWNVVTDNVSTALVRTPLEAVSLYGAERNAAGGLPQINAHLDIMRWRPARFRGSAVILRRLSDLLRARRRSAAWDEPVGILTHHRNLDPDAWEFLAALLDWSTAEASQVRWRSADALLEGVRASAL